MKKNEMCDSIGRVHEFMLSLKKAGLNDSMIQRVINAKNNYLAEKMVIACQESLNDLFELVCEFEFQTMPIKQSEFVGLIRKAFYQNEYQFDEKLRSYQDNGILNGDRKKASIYRVKEPVVFDVAQIFIKSKGSFPGFYGLASVWFSEFSKKEKRIEKCFRVVGLTEEGKRQVPVLTKFANNSWHFAVNTENLIHEKSLLLALNEV